MSGNKTPEIREDNVEKLLDARFVKVFDLHYAPGKSYYMATRRELKDIAAIKTDEEFRKMIPDAVSCFVILKSETEEPKLLLFYEYRYPAGRYLLSIPAGLIDKKDKDATDPLIETAKREIFEETGLRIKDTDRIFVVDPCAMSTPGMTDESNALVCSVVNISDFSELNQNGAEGSELFNGFYLATKNEAAEILKNGRDKYGNFFSLMTWSALIYFVSGLWE